MAGTNREARLNLVLTAKDDARQVIESFATNLQETFDGLGAKLVEKMGLNDLTAAVNAAVETIKTDMSSVGASFTNASKDSEVYQRATIEALRQVAIQVESLEQATTQGFRSIRDSMNQTVQSSNDVKEALDFANLQMS